MCAISATLLWGVNSILMRHLTNDGIHYNNMAVIRLLGGALFLWILSLVIEKKNKKTFQYDWIFWDRSNRLCF